jgi:glycosyltransferase involved in cell wall biosynthesis
MAFSQKIKPLVSIIIPVYNREKYIKRALDSVFLQTFNDFEIIIVDDGSTDNTKAIISTYLKDERVHYIFQKNQGVSSALNNGIGLSKGKYISLLHSDDFWIDKEKLKKQINFLEKHQDFSLVGGGIIRIKENEEKQHKILYVENDKDIRESMLFSCLFASSAVVFTKKSYLLSVGFNKELEVCEDWDLWLRLGKLGKMYNFQDYFVHYQESEKSLSNSYYRKSLKYNLRITKEYRRDYPHFRKAIILRFFYYLYSFMPFNRYLLPIASKIKKLVFGKPAYKSTKK